MPNWSQEVQFRKNLLSATSSDKLKNLEYIIFALGPTDIEYFERCKNFDLKIYVNILSMFLSKYANAANSISFIFLSSASVYGECSADKVEGEQTMPLSKYAQSLLEAERFLALFSENSHHRFIVLRLTSVYNRNLNTRVLGKIRLASRENSALELFGTGMETRDFLHSADLFRSIISVIPLSQGFQIYNIGSGISIAISEIVNICKLSNFRFTEKVRYSGIRRSFEPLHMRVSINKIRSFGFSPLVVPKFGLLEYFE